MTDTADSQQPGLFLVLYIVSVVPAEDGFYLFHEFLLIYQGGVLDPAFFLQTLKRGLLWGLISLL